MNTYTLILKHIRVSNAHALSSSFTIGFPAMTAFLGFSHALERKIRQNLDYYDTHITGLAVCNHHFHLRTYRGTHPNARNTLIGQRLPLKPNGDAMPFNEIPYADMDISFVLEISSDDVISTPAFCEQVRQHIMSMRVAGGDIHSLSAVFFEEDDRRALRALMPGYVLISRKQRLEDSFSEDAMGDLIHALACHHEYVKKGDGTGFWKHSYSSDGWVIPIGVGFRDLSGPKQVKNQRNSSYEHHFVEPVVSLGEFVMPYRFQAVSQILWRYDVTDNMYLCVNDSTI